MGRKEGAQMISDITPMQAYFLYVNQQRVPEIFETLEETKVAATPYMQNQPALQIKSTWNGVRNWNYRYDLKQWLELMRG
ncbi:MAG: hypothetical protein CAF41_014675 [Nitrospira sp. CG24A]|nr:MAG: hypothetical protein CAF41_014675 [Nitrospira sp. CG24A]